VYVWFVTCQREKPSRREVTAGLLREFVDMLFFASFLPLIWLVRQWAV
jgi:hypothetical protein